MPRPTSNQRERLRNQTFMEVDFAWKKFVDTAMPADAPTHQLIEMRKAFVSGFWICLNEMLLKVGDQAEDLDVEALEAWRQDTNKTFNEICN